MFLSLYTPEQAGSLWLQAKATTRVQHAVPLRLNFLTVMLSATRWPAGSPLTDNVSASSVTDKTQDCGGFAC